MKIQSDSDCQIILKAIKWMQKIIRNKQATWSWGFVRRWRKVCYDHHQAPKKHSMCFFAILSQYAYFHKSCKIFSLPELNTIFWVSLNVSCSAVVHSQSNEMKMWSSQLWLRFKQLQIKPKKCFQGFNGIRTLGKHFSGLICDCLNRNHNCDDHIFISFVCLQFT